MADIYYKKFTPEDEEPYVELSNTQKDTDWTKWTPGTVAFLNEDVSLKDSVLVLPSNCTSLFESTNYIGITWSKLDTSEVTITKRMFYNASSSSSRTLDMSSWDLSSITSMSEMFLGNLNLAVTMGNHPETTNLTNTSSMFNSYSASTTIDISGLNTSNVTSMSSMFNNCRNVTTIRLGSTESCTSCANMFNNCSKLTTISITNLDTSKVTSMNSMFNGCSVLSSFDVSRLNTSSVTDMSYLFAGSGFTSLDLSSWNTSSVTAITNMFNGCTKLTSLNLGEKFDVSRTTNLNSVFRNCKLLTELDLSSFDTALVTSTQNTFYDCSALTTIYVSRKWDMSNVTSSTNMFTNCTSLRGAAGTTYDNANPKDKTYAHGDGGPSNPGYLTLIGWIEYEVWLKENNTWAPVEVYR